MGLLVEIKKKLKGFSLDVSFSIDGEYLGILGPSGSGKSMTLKCIAGVETPDEGRIVLNGKVLFDSEKKINLIPPGKKYRVFIPKLCPFSSYDGRRKYWPGFKTS